MKHADTDAWILDSVFLGPDRRYWKSGSLVLGIAGPMALSVASCGVCGLLSIYSSDYQFDGFILGVIAFLFGCGGYFSGMMTLHLLATCQLPISLRLSLIYLTIFLCWTALVVPTGQMLTSADILATLSLCLGGFVLRWWRCWRAVSWNQPIASRRVTIFSLMDVTTAIAITLWLVSIDPESFDPRRLAGYLLGTLVLSLLGLHVWARLLSLSDDQRQSGTGFGIWMALNTLGAFLVFVGFAAAFSTSPVGLLGFIAAPAFLLVAHVWTEVPLRWLRGCGWSLIRVDQIQTSSADESTGPNNDA